MAEVELVVGQIVNVPAGRGTVRFYGATQFSTGKWVGIELTEQNGKNDGSVQGVHYFDCPSNYGIFVRPRNITSVEPIRSPNPNLAAGPSIRTSPPSASTAPAVNSLTSRPALGHKRTSSIGLTRGSSLRGSAPLSASTSRSVSPQKPSSSGKASPAQPAAPPPRFRAPNPPSPTKRLSTSVAVQRPSFSRGTPDPTPPSPIVTTTSRRLTDPKPPEFSTSPLSVSPSPSQRTSSPPNAQLPPTSSITQVVASSSNQNGRQSALGREISVIAEGELRKLKARVFELESKGRDDVREIESLQNQLEEASVFIKAKPKLLAKLNQLQQDLTEAKRSLADSQQLANLNENRVAESQEQLEMCMLDKEVAEERAEASELELSDLQEKMTSMEAELEALREGGADLSALESDSPAKLSLAYSQLEKHNERLKEALLRLREVSHETESDQRHRIAELEKELAGVDELHAQYESTLVNLTNAENQIDELKLQLDDALGAEEILVQLTERNLILGEKIEEMRITIEDLESLKELNDELEENHVETEKTLNEELQSKEAEIRDQTRQISTLEDNCQDYETTISQFRDLVLQLQGELDALRTVTQNAQDESATAASQSAAVMSLNMKLQSSAAKNQARNIELELRKIEARESKELLAIVQPYLPQLYIESDSDATNCYMFFQRLAAKADLINHVVAQVHGLPDSLSDSVSEVIVGVCEMRGRISSLSTLCKRFAAVLKRCNVDAFLNVGKIFPEVSPLEKRIDMHIELLRKDEFREMECVSDINKIHVQFDHIAETYFDGFDHDLGERELGYTQLFDNDLDMFIASIGLTKTALETVAKDEDVTIAPDDDLIIDLIAPLQRLLDQSKGAKTLSRKMVKRMEDLVKDSTALKAQIIPQLRALNNRVPDLVSFGIQLAQTIMPHLNDIRNNKQVLSTKTFLNYVHPIVSATIGKNENGDSSWPAIGDAIATLVVEAGLVVPTIMEAESIIKINGIAPWVHRIDDIKSALAVNVEAERKVTQLAEENHGLARRIKERDQTVQEAGVKIELMERRLDAVKKQGDTISELENEISKARKQERSYEEAIEQLQSDLDSLEKDNAKLKSLTAGVATKSSSGPRVPESENLLVESNLETSYLLEQIDALRGAVRYLRRENSYLKGQDLLREIRALPTLPDFSSRPATPELESSASQSGSDTDDDRPRTPRTLRDLATEANVLYREVLTFSSTPRVVDLSLVNKRRMGSEHGGKAWMRKKLTPSHQLLERKAAGEDLSRRVRGLIERANMINTAR